jgi:hypothetical protein
VPRYGCPNLLPGASFVRRALEYPCGTYINVRMCAVTECRRVAEGHTEIAGWVALEARETGIVPGYGMDDEIFLSVSRH